MCYYILLLSLHQYFLKQTGTDNPYLISNLLVLPKIILFIFSVLFIIQFRYNISTLSQVPVLCTSFPGVKLIDAYYEEMNSIHVECRDTYNFATILELSLSNSFF